MYYAKMSFDCLHNTFDWNNHYTYRFTVIFPTALMYLLFGLNDFASMLPAMFLSLGIIGIFYHCFKENPFYLFLSICLYFSFKWNLFYADKIMPDIHVSFFVFGAWYAYIKHKIQGYKSLILPIICGLFLFLAFNAKGTVILILPLIACYFIVDILLKKMSFWKTAALIAGSLLIAYLAIIRLITGSTFKRFEAINANKYVNNCSYDLLGFEHLLDRWTNGFAQFLLNEWLIIPFVIGCIGLLFFLFNRKNKDLLFYSSTILILFLCINFMTISLNSYNPICLDPRHILVITPITTVCSVFILKHLFSNKMLAKTRFLFLILGFITSLFLTYKYAVYCKSLKYNDFRKDIISLLKTSDIEGVIYGSEVFVNLGNYYTEYNLNDKISLQSIQNMENFNSQSQKNYVVRNWYSEWHAKIDEKAINKKLNAQGLKMGKEKIITTANQQFTLYPIVKN